MVTELEDVMAVAAEGERDPDAIYRRSIEVPEREAGQDEAQSDHYEWLDTDREMVAELDDVRVVAPGCEGEYEARHLTTTTMSGLKPIATKSSWKMQGQYRLGEREIQMPSMNTGLKSLESADHVGERRGHI